MSGDPLVSVLIPAFNVAPYIGEALKSVAAQTYENHEVIVVDDHSSDETADVAKTALRDLGLRGRVVRRPHATPKGAGACRNHAASLAGGELIGVLDADDLWLPTHLERAVHAFRKHGSGLAAYCCRAEVLSMDNGTAAAIAPRSGFPAQGKLNVLSSLLDGMFIVHVTMILGKAHFDRIPGYHEGLSCGEDWWMALHLAKQGPFHLSDEVGCRVRVRAHSQSNSWGASGRHCINPMVFRDALQICIHAANSGQFEKSEVRRMRRAMIGFIRPQLRDSVRTQCIRDVWQIARAPLLTAPIDWGGAAAIWCGASWDVAGLAAARLMRAVGRDRGRLGTTAS